MRYVIQNNLINSSFLIDAPYDSIQDAEQDIENGITHNCELCVFGECPTQDALQKDNIKWYLNDQLIGE